MVKCNICVVLLLGNCAVGNCRYDLTKCLGTHVTNRINSANACFRAFIGNYIAPAVKLKPAFKKRTWIAYTLAGIVAEIVMVVGYFVFEAIFMSYGMGAIVSVLPNISQAAVGIAIGASLMTLIDRTHLIEKIMRK